MTDYCGFSCTDVLAKVQEAVDEIKEFSKANPEYSLVMLGKALELVYNARTELIRMKPEEPISERNAIT